MLSMTNDLSSTLSTAGTSEQEPTEKVRGWGELSLTIKGVQRKVLGVSYDCKYADVVV